MVVCCDVRLKRQQGRQLTRSNASDDLFADGVSRWGCDSVQEDKREEEGEISAGDQLTGWHRVTLGSFEPCAGRRFGRRDLWPGCGIVYGILQLSIDGILFLRLSGEASLTICARELKVGGGVLRVECNRLLEVINCRLSL
jgi:hypothetical protein